MARRKTEDLQKHTLNLRRGDMDKLALLFPGRNPSVVLRQIISKFLDRHFSDPISPSFIATTSAKLESPDE